MNNLKLRASSQAFAYDVETFPNFFSATFVGLSSDDTYQFVIHPSRDERRELATFLDGLKAIVGFNSLYYDTPMLRKFLLCQDDPRLLELLYDTSQRLISDNSREDDEVYALRFPQAKSWRDLDLMKVKRFDQIGVGLKQVAVNLRWNRIQDLPLHYTSLVEADQIDTVLDYNLNDVLITKALYFKLKPDIELRKSIGKLYDVDVINASDSKMANVLLEKYYTAETGKDVRSFRNLRTNRDSIQLRDCIAPNISFETKECSQLLEEIQSIRVWKSFEFRYKKSFAYNGKIYDFGVGGLHSRDNPAKFISTDDETIRDADVASYYPSILIQTHTKPEHLGEEFLNILKRLTKERIDAKKAKDDIKASSLKITINAIFGKLGSDVFWLYDPLAFLTVTLSGQLYLLMLIERLSNQGVEILSANTDGILCRVRKDQEEIYQSACAWWQELTGFTLEFTDYKFIARRDVNNYCAMTDEGKVKTKGVFVQDGDLSKGYRMPILARALNNHFIHGIPPEKTIEESKDILDFAISQKTGREFILEYHTADGKIEKLQKNNRFFISRGGGALIKRHQETDKAIALYAGQWTRVLNWLERDRPFESYDVDFDFYRKEIEKIIDTIEPKIVQLSLF